MCNCISWARIPTEENGFKYPMSNHHPLCKYFKVYPFILLEIDGIKCVMDTAEAEAMLTDSDEQYSISTVMLTRDQFDRMDEFHGF